MKSKCSFILKASTALVLALLMLFGTVATSLAAVVDQADTGAKADLAETGYTNCNVYTSSSINGTYTKATSFSGNAGSFTLTLTDNQTIYFYIQGDSNSNYFGGDWTLPYNQTYNMGQYYNTSDLKKMTFVATNGAGTYTFTVTDVNSGGGTIKATGGNGSSGSGGGSGTASTEGISTSTVTIDGTSNLTQMYYDFSSVTSDNAGNYYSTNGLLYDEKIGGKKNVAFLPSGVDTSWVIAKTQKGNWAEIKYSARNSNNKFMIAAAGTSATWGTYTDFDAAPANVVSGTDLMVYIQSYSNTGEDSHFGLRNSDGSTKIFARRVSKSIGYVTVPKSSVSTVNYITNNIDGWAGVANSTLGSATQGGGLYVGNDSTSSTAATTADTKSIAAFDQGTSTINVETKTSKVTSAIGSNLSFQYYIDGTKVGKTYQSSTSYVTTALDVSSLAAGTHTLKTVLTDGGVYYVADTDTFTVNTPEVKHAVTTGVSPASSGVINIPSGTEVGESTPTTITATPAAGYQFSSWTFGTGITGASTTDASTTITTKTSGDYTVTANLTKKNLTVTKGTHAHGDFTISPTTAQVGDTVTISDVTIDKGYTAVSFATSPTTTISGSGTNNRTFTMPGENVTVNATYTAKTGNTITRTVTPTGGGILYTGTVTSTTSTTSTYTTGTTMYARAKADAAYTFTKFVITYANGDEVEVPLASATSQTGGYYRTTLNTDGSKFDSDSNTGNITVEAVFTPKPLHKITVVSSNNIYGTATATAGTNTATVVEAYEGQSVTLTAKENTGTFYRWSVTSGTMSTVNNQTSKSLSFTMGSADLTIKANFNAYSGSSPFYYNSYETNGSPSSSRYGAQMTEAKLGGETYSYYHVTGRTGADQLFTVSYGSPKYNSYECFFGVDSSWGNDAPYALFYATDGQNLGSWAQMYYIGDDGHKTYRIAIPDGARSVRFKHGSNETAELFFSDGNNGWYTNGNMSSLTAYANFNPVPYHFYENFNGTNKYTNACGSGGFHDYNANRGQSHAYSVPNNMDESQRGDYYILVLYSGKSYTINGVQHDVTLDPEIIWLPTLPDETTDLARIYAKDGCINADRKSTRVIGTTNITASDTVKNVSRGQISGITDYATARAEKGKSITITTTINSTYASKYVVKGWDVNGETVGLDTTPTSGNTYSVTFTVPNADKVEITPIYWLKSTYNTTTFFVKDFNKVPSGWGDALYYYYWGGSQVDVENEEKYPGQPFVHAGGQYYAQVPSDVTGVTLNNAVWDTVHAELIMGLDSADSAKQAAHYQTYDYDNFAKIKEEVSNINSIYFTFKYESKKDNLNSTSASSGTITLSQYNDTNGNGWEDYKDTLGRDLNIFGGTDVSGSGKLYVVSNGYARNYQGRFATEWSIYYTSDANPTTASFVGTIPSSALILNEATDFSKTKYVTDYTPALTSYQTTWQTLKNTYSTVPVSITYEKALRYGNSQIHTVSGDTTNDPADRIDGKWDYTKDTDFVTANIKIQLSNDNGATYTDDPFSSGNTGTTTEAQAFFNNTGKAYLNTHEVTLAHQVQVSTTETFKLKTVPQPSTGYQFVGWYRLDDSSENPEPISTLTEAESLMSSKATFIARYKMVTSGNLVINHLADGAGSATNHTVKAEIYAAGAVIGTDAPINVFEGSSITIDDPDYISSSSTYKIRVTLTAIADANSYIANNGAATTPVPTVACSQDATKFYKNPAYTRSGRFDNSKYPVNIVTKVETFNVSDLYSGTTQNVKVLTYTTTFNKLPTYTINYKYHGRQSGDDYLTFTRTITLSANEAEGKNAEGTNYSGNNGTALRPTYITTAGDGLVNDITFNAPDQNDLQTQVFNKVIHWKMEKYDPTSATDTAVTLYADETDPTYTLKYSYVDANGNLVSGENIKVTGSYNKLITLDGSSGTFATRATNSSGQKFSYWADANNKPLTNSILYSMRLIDNVTIHPVYGGTVNGWESAIDKITRTHESSDTSDNIFTDFALRFTGFDSNGRFIQINPDHLNDYKVGVAVVYDTAGDNTTETAEQVDDSSSPFYNLSEYTDAKTMIQSVITKGVTSARLKKVSDTTYVTRFDATNSSLTNLNRIDLAVKYNYKQNYKRKYDAYAYIVDSSNQVIAVSPVKSGYLYDGTLPVGN